jgi:hypothetical protein
MSSCFITSCKNRNEKGFSLYRIPKIPECRGKWLEVLELIRPHKKLTEKQTTIKASTNMVVSL